MENSNNNKPITTTGTIRRARMCKLLQVQRVAEGMSNHAWQTYQSTEKENDKSRAVET